MTVQSVDAPTYGKAVGRLVDAVRAEVCLGLAPDETARLVAAAIEPFLGEPELLPQEYLRGDSASYQQHVVHVEDDGSFSVVVLVWQPGQCTPIHDHLAWCVAGVQEGVETERRYERCCGEGDTAHLVAVSEFLNEAGTAVGFAPPGDIHMVANASNARAVSIHVYGADISREGSSIRRIYYNMVNECSTLLKEKS